MTTWVLLRGLTREARHWGGFPARFQAAVASVQPDVQIVMLDLSGNGTRHAERSPIAIEETMQQCRQELQVRGYQAPYHLLAMSLGGMVAVAWAQQYPAECQRLVLLNTSLKPLNRLFQRLRPRAVLTVIKLMFMHGEAREQEILKLTSNRAAERQSVVPEWTDWARECPVSRLNALRQLLAAARFKVAVQPPVPMLLLAGAQDRLVNADCSRVVATAWQTEFALHPDAGHDLTLDDEEWVAEEVKTWLARHEN
jgi:pimeloyl-ACP methyl ester carboxylesterase